MSKIYEALLQAEIDRAAATNGAIDSSAATGKPEHDILRRLRQEAAPAPAVAPVSGRPQPTELRDARESAAIVDFSNVRTNSWNPSFRQLPALEERGRAVEQFHSLRSRMHEFRDLNKLKSLLISSGLPQEGKSFIAANLAISFARHKSSRVLLIDGDMRRSTQHKLLGCPSEPGLTEYLAGKVGLNEILQRARPNENGQPLPRGLGSLTFIGAGVDAENAADLSGSSRFGELIKAVTPYFDWIVVDSSPVNLVADGVNLARACDGVLLVARGGTTKFDTAQRALLELKASKILGFVLNAVHKPPATGGYYGYDSYEKVSEDTGDRPGSIEEATRR